MNVRYPSIIQTILSSSGSSVSLSFLSTWYPSLVKISCNVATVIFSINSCWSCTDSWSTSELSACAGSSANDSEVPRNNDVLRNSPEMTLYKIKRGEEETLSSLSPICDFVQSTHSATQPKFVIGILRYSIVIAVPLSILLRALGLSSVEGNHDWNRSVASSPFLHSEGDAFATRPDELHLLIPLGSTASGPRHNSLSA